MVGDVFKRKKNLRKKTFVIYITMPPKKKKKANVRGNKGGCKIGRKGETPKGGCKYGKRDPTKEERKAASDAAFRGARKMKVAEDKAKAAPKKPVKKPTSRPKSAPRNQTGGMPKSKLAAKAGIKAGEKLPFKKKPKKKSEPDEYKRKVKVGTSDRTTRSAPAAKGVIRDKAAKKARIQEKVRALGKKQVEKKKEKKKDFTAKPKPKPKPKEKEPKYIYPRNTYSIRDGEGGNVDEYAVHKGKVYKYFTFVGERVGQIDIAQPDINDESVINKIKKLAPKEKLVRDKAKKAAKAAAAPKPKVKQTAGGKLTGLTAAQMNAMSPEKLFGMLPVRVASGVVLNPKRTGVKVAQTSMGEFLGRQFREENEALGKDPEEPIAGVFLDNAVFDLIHRGVDSGRQPIGSVKGIRDPPKFSKNPERTLRTLVDYYVSSDRKIKPSQLPKLLPKMSELAPKIVADMKDIFKYRSKKAQREAEAEMLAYLKGYKPNYKQFDFQMYQTKYIKELKAKYPKAKFVIKSFEEDGISYSGVYVNGKFAGHSGGSDAERAKTNKKVAEILK